MRRTPTTWYQLRWPRQVTSDQLHAAFAALTTVSGTPCILEASGSNAEVIHRLGLYGQDRSGLSSQLRDAVPGLGLVPIQRPARDVDRAIRLRFSTPARALRTDDPERVTRSVLTALADVGKDEVLTLQWVLGRPLIPTTVPSDARLTGDPVRDVVSIVVAPQTTLDAEAKKALRDKRSEPGWRALGRLGVQASTAGRQRQLMARLAGALRTAESPGLSLRTRPINPRDVSHATLPWRFPTRLNLSELVAISGWPVGVASTLPVASAGSRALPPSRRIPRSGRVVGTATFPGRERTLALNPSDSLRHTEVLGPTGTGKSTLLVNLIVQDMERHRGVLVLDPKGDLITDVLNRIPDDRVADVVVLDPTDTEPVGLNPLALSGRPPELVADQLLSVFHNLYAAHWGPRTQDILHAGLLTLARFPGATLAALPLLLSDGRFRRRVMSGIDDPIALGPFWAAYEQWSDAERATATAPVLNKLRPFLLRPQLRAVIGQSAPRFQLNQLFTERKIVLVNLAKGLLGPEASALLGALVLAQFWQATLGRAAIPQALRHPVFVYLDEFADYLQLGTDLGDALGMARGLGAGLILAHQFLHQLDPAMRSAVLANARSRVCFQLAAEDARVMAAGSDQPAPEDFTSLPAFECYLQLVAGGAVQPWCSAATLPAPEPTSSAASIRAHSAASYGVAVAETEAALRELVVGNERGAAGDLAPRRRGGRP
jgi:hypothetical protein